MITQNLSLKLHTAVEAYYRYNPDTLMPLLMTALAVQGKLKVSMTHCDDAVAICELSLEEIAGYDWVKLDPALKARVNAALKDGCTTMSVVGIIDESLNDIYEIFHRYDTFTVDEEYHHRIGILYQHSSNLASEQAHRHYATVCLAEALIEVSAEWLKNHFLSVSNHMLVKSGLQPERPRLDVAYALRALLGYSGEGRVYNPFAGCAIAAAAINAGADMYADGNSNDKLFAVARLLNYGMGGTYENYGQRDSTQWTDAGKFEYIVSTYRGYVNGQSAFDFCLSKCFDTLTEDGKFAGIIAPKDIFENQSEVFKEALRRDWVETIVLLPFAEVAVLVNARKDRSLKSKIRFYDLTHPMLRNRPVGQLLEEEFYADILRVADVKKKGYLRSLVVPEFGEREGFEIIKLGDVVKKIRRKTYSLDNLSYRKRVLATIDRTQPYDKYSNPWMQGIVKEPQVSLFAPVCHLKKHSLIVNVKGELEPRLFDADYGSAFFEGAYAFEFKEDCEIDYYWLISELNEQYVLRQLHPYGMDRMLPELVTEDQILGLKLYKAVIRDEDDIEEARNADRLETGFVIDVPSAEYRIHRFLGHGNFGYAYSALKVNRNTGEQCEVVLKEFYPHDYYFRNGVRACLLINDYEALVNDCKARFVEEAKIMRKLGTTPNSHIVPAHECFECEETGTLYYEMPFYRNGSLKDLQGDGFTFTEDMLVNKVIKPICKALHVAHNEKVLHLDIKPENILVDADGEAALIDFCVAKQYDSAGDLVDSGVMKATSMFAPPELANGNMVKFGRQTDIYGLAASIYYLVAAPDVPHPILDFSDEDKDLRDMMDFMGCSQGFIDAVIAGLQFSATSRPANAQAFLRMFPGCEDVTL